jgi:putative salt-induced outer membrane protein YdiY
MRIALSVILVAVIVTVGTCFADEIIFINGERMAGRLIRSEKDKVVFMSDMLSELSIDIDKIQSVVTADPFELHLTSGTVLKGTDLQKSDGFLTLDNEASKTFALGDMLAINPPPQPKIKVTGSLSAGLTDSHGDSSTMDVNVSGEITFRTKKQRLRLKTLYLASREENPNRHESGEKDKVTTEENFSLYGKYDYFLTKKLFAYLYCRYKKDHVNDLDYRVIPGAGLGYQWFEDDSLNFSTMAGLSVLKEKYSIRKDNPEYGEEEDAPRYIKDISRKNDMSWDVGLHLEWKSNSRIKLLSDVFYTEAVDDRDDYLLQTDSEIRLFLIKAFYFSGRAIFEYDNTPSDGVDSTETKYILGLGWSF